MNDETLKDVDRLLEVLGAQDYSLTKIRSASASFMKSLGADSEGHYLVEYLRILHDVKGDYHFVALMSAGELPRTTYYVVAVRVMEDEGGSLLIPNPPAIRLKDFVDNIGTQNVMDFMESLPRDMQADYTKIGLVTPAP